MLKDTDVNAHLLALIESTDDYIWSVDLDFRLLTFNQALKKNIEVNFGVQAAKGMDPEELVTASRAPAWRNLYQRALTEGPYRAEYTTKGGRNLELFLNPIVVDGSTTGISVFGKDITDHKQAELALREAEEKYHTIFDHALEGLYQTLPDGRLLTANPALAGILGYDSVNEFFAATNGIAVNVWADPAERASFLEWLEEKGSIEGYECRFKRKDGSLIWVSLNTRRICANDGKTIHLEGFILDINERKQATAALLESEALLNETSAIAKVGGWEVDLSSGRLTWTREVYRIHEVNENFVPTVESAIEFYAPTSRPLIEKAVNRALDSGEPFDLELEVVTAKNRPLWVHSIGRIRTRADGARVLSGTFQDVTEHKQTLDALRSSEGRLKDAERIAMFGNSTWDAEADTTTWSEGMYRITGKDPSTTPPNRVERAKLYTPESFARLDAAVKRALATGEPYDLELQIIRSDGVLRWTRARGMAVRNESGRVCKLVGTLQDITDQNLLNEKLRESEERYRSTFEQAAVGIVLTSFDGHIMRCNQRFAEIIGYPKEEIAGITFQQITAPEDLANSVNLTQQIAAGKITDTTFEKRYVRKDGSFTWARITISLQRDAAGQPIHYISVLEDINATKAAEERLAAAQERLLASELRYRTIFQTSIDGKLISRLNDGLFIEVNQEYLDMMGYQREEFLGRTAAELHAWVDENSRSELVAALRRDKSIRDRRYRHRRKNGEIFWIQVSATVIDLDGVPCIFSACRDISEEKAAEDRLAAAQETLRVSELRYRTVFQSSLVMIGIIQVADGVIIDANKSFFDALGYEAAEVIGHSTFELNMWADLRDREKYASLLRQHAEVQDFETLVRKKSGELIPVLFSATLVEIDGIACALGVMRDVSEIRAAQEELGRTEKRFRGIFEEAPEGIFQTTPEGKSLALNPAGARLLGFASSEDAVARINNSAHDVWLIPEERARYAGLLEEHGEVHDFLCQLKHTDGTPVWVSLAARKICAPNGQTLYYQGFIQDVSERKRLETALRAKIRELQLLSEINNALLRAKREEDLLAEYCRILVEVGGYRMAWVGFAENSPGKPIVPVAHHGYEDGYLKTLNLTWADTARGRGPTGTAVRSGKVQVVEQISTNSAISLWREEALKRGYQSSIALPFSHSDGSMACLTAYGAMDSEWTEAERMLMEQIALDLGFGIKSLRTEIARDQFQEDLSTSLEQTIQVVAETIDQRDPYTAGHQRRVADLCTAIARKLGLSEDRAHGLHLAANIHDLGKIGIPAELLAKPGRLTSSQFNLIKEHAELGYEILKNVKFPWPIADMVRQHHERLDGSGYPLALKEDEILFESKILAVADVVEAMGSYRPYRVSLGIDAALDEILAGSGKKYDSDVVGACVSLFREDGFSIPA